MRQSYILQGGRLGFVLCVAAFVGFVCLSPAQAQKVDKAKLVTAARRADKAAKVLTDLAALPPGETIPKELIEKAHAVAVFPDTDKVNALTMKFWKGFGLVSKRVEGGGWSAPAFYGFVVSDIGWTRMKSGEPGIIMLFMNDDIFAKDRIDLEGSEGPVGEWTPEKENSVRGAGIILYSLSEGKLRGISVEDDASTQAGINSDNNVNKAVYGLKAREVLSGKTPAAAAPQVPPEVTGFQTALANLWK